MRGKTKKQRRILRQRRGRHGSRIARSVRRGIYPVRNRLLSHKTGCLAHYVRKDTANHNRDNHRYHNCRLAHPQMEKQR